MALSIPTYQVSTTEPTNQAVTITAEFDASSYANYYSFDAGTTWKKYTEPIVVDDNATITLMSRDEDFDEIVTAECVIENIDKVAPSISVAADITAVTNQDVTLTATFEDENEILAREYKIGENGEWTAYPAHGGVVIEANATVYFRATDAAGNTNSGDTIVEFAVSNIDKVAPTITASADVTTITNQDVTVSAVFTDDNDFASKEYKIGDNGVWTAYPAEGGVTITENGSVFFRAKDVAGNDSDVLEFVVDNIDKTAPEAPTAAASTTDPTNQDVTVTAVFSDDSVVKQYKIDDGEWTAYPTDTPVDGIVLEANATVSFRGQDEAGNFSEVTSIEVTNIDKVAPDAPTAAASTTDPTNQDVTVAAVFSTDSVVKEYSLDGQNWEAYTEAIELDANGSVSFRGTDAAGNISDVTTVDVTNIDKVPPVAPTAEASSTVPTNQDVTVTASFSDDSVVKEFSLDGENWADYTEAITFEENGTVQFRGTDNAGNVSEITTVEVTNIDKTAPEAPTAQASITTITNEDVVVSAVFSGDSVGREYSLNGGEWKDYSTGVTLEENGYVEFRGRDAAGNVSEVTTLTVDNIDKVAPTITVAADITVLTNQDVTVTPTFSDNVEVKAKKYTFDINSDRWSNYTEPIVFTDNGVVYFFCADTAGNLSEVVSYEVKNIDKVPPTVTASADITEITNQDVTVSAVFEDDSEQLASQEYSLDGGETWTAYTEGVVFEENGTVQFRATDVAGNVSEVLTFTVDNIDKVAPEAPTATASTTEPTNQNVIVTAVFSDDSVVKEYSLDGESWDLYPDNGVELEENGTVYFTGTDEAGNISEVTSIEVTNIDKVAPEAPTAAADVTDPTNQNVTVTAVFSDDSVEQQYSIDGGTTWEDYPEAGVVFADNGTVLFRGIDAAGNISEETSYEVTNIDLVAPDAPTDIVANITELTNTDVIVTAVFSDDSAVKQYSLDGENWVEYADSGVIVKDNDTTVSFRGIDAAGNISDVSTYEVTNIDKEVPTITITPSTTEPTNQNVFVTAVFEDNIGVDVKQYSLDGGKSWIEYTEPIEVEGNVTISFLASDTIGNFTTTTFTVDNIDKIAPEAPVAAASTTDPTNQDVTVTATFSADSVVKQFSTDAGETWEDYTEAGVVFAENGAVSFRGQDDAGNYSELTTITVDNIDKVAPEAPVLSADIETLTNTDVIVTATFADDVVVKQFSVDGGETWNDYAETGVVVVDNAIVIVRGTDNAGNFADASYEVTNIDKVLPVITTTQEVTGGTVGAGGYTDGIIEVSAFAEDEHDTVIEYTRDTRHEEMEEKTGWIVYDPTKPIKFTRNGPIYFRATDAAGNVAYQTTEVTIIDKAAPVLIVKSDITTPTNGIVEVSAVVEDSSPTIIEYSRDTRHEDVHDKTGWIVYDPEKPIKFTRNGPIYFRATDGADHVTYETYEVTNIDKVAPDAPTVDPSTTDPTNQAVTVNAVFSDDSVVKEYSLDGEEWIKYVKGVVFEDNGTVQFRGIDAAGNTSKITTYEVTNIDLIPPEAPVADPSTADPTNQPVTVSAIFSDDTVVKEYSLDGEEWEAYEDGVVFEDNGTVFFRGFDAAGNVSEVSTYEVTNIDLVAPEAPTASADITDPTNQDVTLTAVFSNDTVVKEYSLDGEEWFVYPDDGVVLEENSTVQFRGFDAAGNVSDVTSIEVTNIDKIPPEAPVAAASTTAPTNQPVSVSATFSADTVTTEYSLDGENWEEYTDAIVFDDNGTVFFRGIDDVGNISDVTAYEVTNIDLIPPEAPIVVASTTELTNKSVTLTATFSGDTTVKQYSLDGGQTWQRYRINGISVAENQTVLVRGLDAAGNSSEATAFTVENIDKVAPANAYNLMAVVSGQTVSLTWGPSTDNLSGVKEYILKYGPVGKEMSTVNTIGTSYVIENLPIATWAWSVQVVDNVGNYSDATAGDYFVVTNDPTPGPAPIPTLAKNDIDGNGISEVMFQWTKGDNQIGFWMNGTNEWQGQAQPHSADWAIIGTYDMNADGKADLIMSGKATIVEKTGTYIGYYESSVDTDENWHTIGFLNESGDWNNAVGNLSGAIGKNSIVWYSPELYALGIWKDAQEDWVSLSNQFGGDAWTLAGCGDFDGDGKDSVLMSLNNGQQFYTVDIDGNAASLGGADWTGWTVSAIGDFFGDGKDDIVLFHEETGSMAMLTNGSADSYLSIGQLDASDWFVVGAGDYNGDQQDELLVRQYSTGMLGYYAFSGENAVGVWNELGRGVSTDWTVIA